MKTTPTRIDPVLARAEAKTPAAGLARVVVNRLVAFLRALKNRRAVMSLEDFTPEQLADIGLTREDLRHSLNASWYDDPSVALDNSARRRRAGLPRLSQYDL